MMKLNALLSIALLAIALFTIEITATPSAYSVSRSTADTTNHAPFVYTSHDGQVLPWGRMEFNGTIDGIPITDTGSFDEIYMKNGLGHLLAVSAAESNSVDEVESGVVARDSLEKEKILCMPINGQPQWEEGYLANVNAIISQSKSWGGNCIVQARTCYPVKCEEITLLSICNDNPYAIIVNCPYLGTFAEDIKNKCVRWIGGWFLGTFRVGGQMFDTDGYNLIINKVPEGCH